MPSLVRAVAVSSETRYVAAVAAITAGLFGQQHTPKVIGGLGKSIIVPTSKFMPVTVLCDVTVKGAGAAPNVH